MHRNTDWIKFTLPTWLLMSLLSTVCQQCQLKYTFIWATCKLTVFLDNSRFYSRHTRKNRGCPDSYSVDGWRNVFNWGSWFTENYVRLLITQFSAATTAQQPIRRIGARSTVNQNVCCIAAPYVSRTKVALNRDCPDSTNRSIHQLRKSRGCHDSLMVIWNKLLVNNTSDFH